MANQIVEEGERLPADVFLTENSPAMTIVDNAGLFAPVPRPPSTTSPRVRPELGHWTGFPARSTGGVYNTDNVTEADTARSDPRLRRPRVGRRRLLPDRRRLPGDRQPSSTLEGEEATRKWLDGLTANGVVLPEQPRR